jgi:hypothetical protein
MFTQGAGTIGLIGGPRSAQPGAYWRFVLPGAHGDGSEQVLVLDSPAGLAERRVAIDAAQARGSAPACRAVDAVLLFANAQAPLEAAVERLQPGGGLYWEIDRRRGRPGNLRGLLRRSGLTPVGAYWAWPDFAHAEVLVPVDRPAALRWYLECVRGTSDSRGA